MTVLETLYSAGFSAYLHGFGAIDSWLGIKTENTVMVLTNADAADLARLFEDIRYPGIGLADAALYEHGEGEKEKTWYFRCADSLNEHRPSFKLLKFYRDCETRSFNDPCGIYPLLSEIRRQIARRSDRITKKQTAAENGINPLEILKEGINLNFDRTRSLMDAALILAKYFPPDTGAWQHIEEIAGLFFNIREGSPPEQEEQRIFLSALMTCANSGLGLELLKAAGFVDKFWPELAILDRAVHSKEFHPEGNAWEHTIETFRHRKTCAYDLRLSLGLLLHDTGKPIATSTSSHRFDSHAELGVIQSRRFLERLGFNSSIISDVCFLVRNHMLPAALPRLPFFRTGEIMASPLFPLLMELYRCDESSSFKGLDGYYESSAFYKSFLKNRRNPYRSADGRKLDKRPMRGKARV